MEPRRRRCGTGSGREQDRLSGLPDEMLHIILRHLRSFRAAVRTSALSRRWRRVWASDPDPDLVLSGDLRFRCVKGALDAYEAAAGPAAQLRGLEVTNVPTCGVAPWLRFAARRLPGALHLRVPYSCQGEFPRFSELELPPLERAASITLDLGSGFHIRPLPSGVFEALADLEITSSTMEAPALEVLVSTQCPRLRKLSVSVTLVPASGISLRSATLQHLKFHVPTPRLDIAAPALKVLDTLHGFDDAHISAPNLAEVTWGLCDRFDFTDAGRHLRLLDLTLCTCAAMAPLVRRFDLVDELRLPAPLEGDKFWRFFRDNSHDLPMCQNLCQNLLISSLVNRHAFIPCVLRLLRGNGVRKLGMHAYASTCTYCSTSCSCRSPQNAIIFDSLEEIQFDLLGGDEHLEKIMKQLLSMCSLAKLKSVEINRLQKHASSPSDEVYNMIRGMCPPNVSVRLNLFP